MKNVPANSRRRLSWADGFAVSTVMALLAVALYPSLAQARRGRDQATCLSNLRQIGRGVGLYQADWDDQLPLYDPLARDDNLRNLPLERYGVGHQQLSCPASSFVQKYNRNDYTLRFLFDLAIGEKHDYKRRLPEPNAVIATCPWHLLYGRSFHPAGHHENELILWLNGSVSSIPRRDIRIWQYDPGNSRWLDPSVPLRTGTRFHYAYPGEPFPPQLADL